MPLSDESCTVPWVRVERLSESHDREAFSCGRESIDRWFREDASDQDRQGNVATWACVDAEGAVCGFFACRTHVISVPPSLSNTRRRRWGVNEEGLAPALLIAKLGLDRAHHGRGIGAELLSEALRVCVDASDQVACKLIAVDAFDEELVGFYEKAGFVRLGTTRLLFTVKAARALICGERVPR